MTAPPPLSLPRALRRALLVCAALAVGGPGCGNDAPPRGPGGPVSDAPGQAPDTDDRARLRAELEQTVKDRSCDADSECASVAVGSKSCGGPEEYLIYSRSRVDEADLRRRAQAYTELDRRLDERDGIVSDCAFTVEPVTACQNGQCEVVGTVDARRGDWRDESGQ